MQAFPVRIYYEDTDAAGIVYYANYLKFAERARTEWLRELGIGQHGLMQSDHLGFVVRKVTAEFLSPARLDDLLTIASEITDIRKVGLSMRQVVLRGSERIAELQVDLVCVDSAMKPAPLPEKMAKSLAI